jgi:predicted GIY-YIG superfamily endonuclease
MNRYAKPENFGHPIKTPLLRLHFVYRAFDADDRLLYVGCTHDPDKRLAAHKWGADWWEDAVRLSLAGPYNYETARQIEYDAIESERSLHNHSRERRELRRLASRLFMQHMDRLIQSGMDSQAAGRAALGFIDEALPDGRGRGPVVIDDTTIPRARRLVADHARGAA